MKKSKSVKKIILIIIICIVLLLIGGWWALSVSIYNQNFNRRFESDETLMLHVEDFDGLQCTEYTFPSDKGQQLAGYLYSTDTEPHGIVVIAHGLGAGHNSYMDCAYYFAQNGYDVFAYDATGNDKSEGDGVGCIPQGVADLDHAISFVEDSGNFPDLPIVLFGHSWGGYSVCNVLTYHPEVKAVIECAGCNRSSDLFEAGGKDQAGNVIYTMMPFIRLHEYLHYGRYASNTAMDGFAASDAAVMAVHSTDDGVVPIEYGFDKYYAKYKDDPRFTFVKLENKGHNYLFHDQTYINALQTEFDNWRESLSYDRTAAENKARYREDRAEFYRTHLDREKWTDSLDKDMFAEFVEFYDANI